jgi:hypothetical protein
MMRLMMCWNIVVRGKRYIRVEVGLIMRAEGVEWWWVEGGWISRLGG